MTTRLLGELDVKTRQVGLINGVLSSVLGGAALPDVLKIFYSNLKTVCPIDRMSIARYDSDRRVFHIPFAIKSGRLVETHEAPRSFNTTPLSEVIESKTPVLRRNLKSEKAYSQDTEWIRKGFGCEMLFPLITSGEAFATFQVGCFEPERLTTRHLRIISEILPAIAVAIYQLFDREKALFA